MFLATSKQTKQVLFKPNLELPPPEKNAEAWMASGKMLGLPGLPRERWRTRPGPAHILRGQRLDDRMTLDLVNSGDQGQATQSV